MPTTTTNMSLKKAVNADNANTYLVTDLGGSMDNIDAHDHGAGKGVGVRRLQTATTPAANGEVQVTGDTIVIHNGTSTKTLVEEAKTQTLTNKTLTSPTINTPTFSAGAIATAAIADLAVTTAKIADGAVTSAKLNSALEATANKIQTATAPTTNGGVQVTGDTIVLHNGTTTKTLVEAAKTQTLTNKTLDGTSNAMVRIAETILGANAASVTFSSIPSNFRNLMLVLTARAVSAPAGNVMMRFNGDTAANYSHLVMWGKETNTDWSYEELSLTGTEVDWTADGNDPANSPSNSVVTIFDYARTTWKKRCVSVGGVEGPEATTDRIYARVAYGAWRSTAAITSITLYLSDGTNIAAGSVFTLYGLP